MAAAPRPTLNPAAGLDAFERDLRRVLHVLDATSLEELGWARPTPLSLLVPMSGTLNGGVDQYLLRLGFSAYSESPPSALFVNPKKQTYEHPVDRAHIPNINAPDCQTHAEYPRPGGGTMQLVCSSVTQEFYDVQHDVKPQHLWRNSDNFLTTLTTIARALGSHYQGRFPAHG